MDKLVKKYRNPLLLASIDLQSRLWNMFQGRILDTYRDYKSSKSTENRTIVVKGNGQQEQLPARGMVGERNGRREGILTHTMFLIGQYLSWTHIMKRQIQFLRFSTVEDGQNVFRTLEAIQNVLSTSDYNMKKEEGLEPFMLWRAEQEAIGEIMTDYANDPICIMYSEFTRKFEDDKKFTKWFCTIREDFETLADLTNQMHRHGSKGHRLWHLQHLLVDLIQRLDVEHVTNKDTLKKVQGPDNECECSNCVLVGKHRTIFLIWRNLVQRRRLASGDP